MFVFVCGDSRVLVIFMLGFLLEGFVDFLDIFMMIFVDLVIKGIYFFFLVFSVSVRFILCSKEIIIL